MGCSVVFASTVEDGLAINAAPSPLDAALHGVTLVGRQGTAVVGALSIRGVLFVFPTGYVEAPLPRAYRGHASVQKRFTESLIREALMAFMGLKSV